MKGMLLGFILAVCLGLAIHPNVDLVIKAILLVPLFITLLPEYVRAAND